MKKSTFKLAIQRETLRVLAALELGRVAGGLKADSAGPVTGCPNAPLLDSEGPVNGCPVVKAEIPPK